MHPISLIYIIYSTPRNAGYIVPSHFCQYYMHVFLIATENPISIQVDEKGRPVSWLVSEWFSKLNSWLPPQIPPSFSNLKLLQEYRKETQVPFCTIHMWLFTRVLPGMMTQIFSSLGLYSMRARIQFPFCYRSTRTILIAPWLVLSMGLKAAHGYDLGQFFLLEKFKRTRGKHSLLLEKYFLAPSCPPANYLALDTAQAAQVSWPAYSSTSQNCSLIVLLVFIVFFIVSLIIISCETWKLPWATALAKARYKYKYKYKQAQKNPTPNKLVMS